MKVTKISVLIFSHGTDKIYLETDLPSPFPPGISEPFLTLSADVQRGKGVEYAQEHLSLFYGLPINVTDASQDPPHRYIVPVD